MLPMTSDANISALCHRARRAFLKKEKRRRLRQAAARSREEARVNGTLHMFHNYIIDEFNRQLSPSYLEQIQIEERKLQLEEEQRARDEEAWLERERIAQELWQAKLAKLQYDKQQSSPLPHKESNQLSVELPTAPVVYVTTQTRLQNPIRGSKELCSFFRKTGACRFGESCSRFHDYPSRNDPTPTNDRDELDPQQQYHSRLVLRIVDMFEHCQLRLNAFGRDLDDPDLNLEMDEAQLLADFADFYHDVRGELEARWGRIAAFRTCRNKSAHLRGSVYVEFYRGSGAAWDAAENCQGRWYAGRQLSCMVVRLGGGWREAVCGLYHRGRCPKGDEQCNFLHVFLNPGETVFDLHRALRQQLGELPSGERSGSREIKQGVHSVMPKCRRNTPSASPRHHSVHRYLSGRHASTSNPTSDFFDTCSSVDKIPKKSKQCTSPIGKKVPCPQHSRKCRCDQCEQQSRRRRQHRDHKHHRHHTCVSPERQTHKRSKQSRESRHACSPSVTVINTVSPSRSPRTAVRSRRSPRRTKFV
ncbi:U2 small nuclear ribonucleoprotein auxiliary [Fasciola gigantica]|uniref:U2 small nuclear ribonucleoprotein auxiliary n=1 Tax=Fasciola gigantica TaxID=46835 RepID=A0A504Z312_FASGI|nr:U2 small nuclear ribonucleoprotein auxiliary [Fasciola gigantica]